MNQEGSLYMRGCAAGLMAAAPGNPKVGRHYQGPFTHGNNGCPGSQGSLAILGAGLCHDQLEI